VYVTSQVTDGKQRVDYACGHTINPIDTIFVEYVILGSRKTNDCLQTLAPYFQVQAHAEL
jgi:hypothetical protein